MIQRRSLLVPVTCALLGAACDDPDKPSASGGAPSSATVAPTPSGRASAAPAKTAEKPADGVDLLKFVLTSEVKNKDPADVLDAAKRGQRVYGHVTVRNRTTGPQRVSLSFRVNGDERTLVDLNIEKSWSWRTWAYVTLRKTDKGELTVHVFDDHGAELGTQSIPIR
jgi:hypothetical protein